MRIILTRFSQVVKIGDRKKNTCYWLLNAIAWSKSLSIIG